jgi:hypothetical protein
MRYVGDEFRARLSRCIQELPPGFIGAKMSLVLGRKKGRLVMIEPPGQLFRGRILEINDGVFVAIKHSQIKQIARAMQQSGVVDVSFGMKSFFVETGKGRGGSDAIEAVTMIEQTKFHIGAQKSGQS